MNQDLEDIKSITLEDIQRFAQKHGQPRTKLLMSVLGKNHDFYFASQSEIGQQLLKDVMARMDVLIMKTIDDEITNEERIEYKILRDIFDKWASRIKRYLVHVQKLKQE